MSDKQKNQREGNCNTKIEEIMRSKDQTCKHEYDQKSMKVKHRHTHKQWGTGCQFGYFESLESPTSVVSLNVLAAPRDEAI